MTDDNETQAVEMLPAEDDPGDVKLYADAFLTKPADFAGSFDIVGRIEDFWLTVVKRPPE